MSYKYSLQATIRTTHPDLDEVRQGLKDLVIKTQDEPGCINFEIKEKVEQPGTFVLWETWWGKEGLKDHYAAPHTAEFLAREWTEILEINDLQPL